MSTVFTEEDEQMMLDAAQRLMRLRQEAQDLFEQLEMMELVAQVRDIPDEDRDVMGGHLFILRDVKDKLRNVRVMASLAEHRVRYWL
jgi:hypothetical protein